MFPVIQKLNKVGSFKNENFLFPYSVRQCVVNPILLETKCQNSFTPLGTSCCAAVQVGDYNRSLPKKRGIKEFQINNDEYDSKADMRYILSNIHSEGSLSVSRKDVRSVLDLYQHQCAEIWYLNSLREKLESELVNASSSI